MLPKEAKTCVNVRKTSLLLMTYESTTVYMYQVTGHYHVLKELGEQRGLKMSGTEGFCRLGVRVESRLWSPTAV